MPIKMSYKNIEEKIKLLKICLYIYLKSLASAIGLKMILGILIPPKT